MDIELRLPADAVVILFLGRLSPLKADLLPIAPVIESLTKKNPQRQLVWVLAGTEDP